MATKYESLSPDLVWEAVRNNNAYLVKRKQAGGVQFSRDPLNLVNKHSRKYEGFVNPQAIGIQPDGNTVSLITKTSKQNQPASAYQTSSFSSTTPSRKLYKSVVNSTAKKGYRADLRAQAVARASAVKLSQRETKKGAQEKKLRGSKARKAAAAVKEASS
ncbi:ribosomal protein L28e [Polychaeton citri CBS 116435]|uniref:Ribosomal protein L28e n=1 Tax=Polychaeton citri CBS 116435 TaxID=1314669 RepID=A0A9P4UNB3_9PEZI|nr:ribosomal protein L28e [Polychaeton citri CBS 116435]